MKTVKLAFIFVLALTFMQACKDDDDNVVVIREDDNDNNNSNETEESYRLDIVEIARAGSDWLYESRNGWELLRLRIVDKSNEFNFLDFIAIEPGSIPFTNRVFVPATGRSEWRVFAYLEGDEFIDVHPAFNVTVKPWEFKTSDSTFSIPIRNAGSSGLLELNLDGVIFNN